MKFHILLASFILLSCSSNKVKTESQTDTAAPTEEMHKRFKVLMLAGYGVSSFDISFEKNITKIENSTSENKIIKITLDSVPQMDIGETMFWFEKNAFNILADFSDNYKSTINEADQICVILKSNYLCVPKIGLVFYNSHLKNITAFINLIKSKNHNEANMGTHFYDNFSESDKNNLIGFIQKNDQFKETQRFLFNNSTIQSIDNKEIVIFDLTVTTEDTLFGTLQVSFDNNLEELILAGINFKSNN